MRTLYLCGAGNSEGIRLAQSVNKAPRRWDRIVLLDDDAAKHGRHVLDVEIAGPFAMLANADPATSAVVNLVARTTQRRTAACARIAAYGVPFATLAHPEVDTAWSRLEDGVLVYEHAIISPETVVGEGSVVFMRAVIGHESQLGRGCVVAAGAVLNARVVLGDGVYVGSNASILPEVRVGADATIGANSLVIADVPAGATVVGVPGQIVDTGQPIAARDAAVPPAVADAELESKVAAVWAEVLGRPVTDLTDNFCHLGGTSLQALRVLEGLRRQHGIDVPVTAFFRFPTVRSFAAHLVNPNDDGVAHSAQARAALRRSRLARGPMRG